MDYFLFHHCLSLISDILSFLVFLIYSHAQIDVLVSRLRQDCVVNALGRLIVYCLVSGEGVELRTAHNTLLCWIIISFSPSYNK